LYQKLWKAGIVSIQENKIIKPTDPTMVAIICQPLIDVGCTCILLTEFFRHRYKANNCAGI
jgi:hypothetical protein